MSLVEASWSSLTPHWQACLEESWQAFCEGTIPIGAVVIDAQGQVLARGRNRIYADSAPDGQVCQTELAHAELNALLALGVDQGDRREWALYTTTEPCPLCMGAFYMSGIRTLHYGSQDVWSGSVNLLGTTPYLSRKPIKTFGPGETDFTARRAESSPVPNSIVGLGIAWYMGRSGGRVADWCRRMEQFNPAGVQLGFNLYESGELRRWAEADLPAQQVFEVLWQRLERGV